MSKRGFTLVEVIISLMVISIIGGIGISAFLNARDSKNLDTISDGLEAVLNQAKSDAVAGKNSSNFGVEFDKGSFTYFAGSSYSAGATTNQTTLLPAGWAISTSTSNHLSYITFNHLSGTAQATGTITISKGASSRVITIGSAGDITVIR